MTTPTATPRTPRYTAEELVTEIYGNPTLLAQLERAAARYARTIPGMDGEDLLQGAMERICKAAATFAPGTSLRAWAHAILRRHACDEARRAGRCPAWCMEDADLELGAARLDRAACSPEQAVTDLMLSPELEAALAGLDAAFREPLLLATLEGLSYEEVSVALGIPTGTVMSRISRAKKKIRAVLKPVEPAEVIEFPVRPAARAAELVAA